MLFLNLSISVVLDFLIASPGSISQYNTFYTYTRVPSYCSFNIVEHIYNEFSTQFPWYWIIKYYLLLSLVVYYVSFFPDLLYYFTVFIILFVFLYFPFFLNDFNKFVKHLLIFFHMLKYEITNKFIKIFFSTWKSPSHPTIILLQAQLVILKVSWTNVIFLQCFIFIWDATVFFLGLKFYFLFIFSKKGCMKVYLNPCLFTNAYSQIWLIIWLQ